MSKEIQKMILEGMMGRLNESSNPFDGQDDLSPSELRKFKKTTPTYVVPEKDGVSEEEKHGDVHLLHVIDPFGKKETHVYFPHLEHLENIGPSGNDFAVKVPGHISPSDVKKSFPDFY